MVIKEINIQNFKSFGNKIQSVRFEKDGELILLCGENGHGKCLSPSTEIDIVIEDKEIEKKLLNFLKNGKIPFCPDNIYNKNIFYMRLNRDKFFKNFDIDYLEFLNLYYIDIPIIKIKNIIKSEIKILQIKNNLNQIKERNIDYWLIRGWSYENSIIKIEEINKNRKKPKNNGILTIEYWLSKGYDELQAKDHISIIQKSRSRKAYETRRSKPNYVKKLSPFTPEYWISIGIVNENEIKYKINSQRKLNKEYWLSRGFSEEESIIQVKNYQYENREKYKKKKKENPELYDTISPTQLKYWIKKSFSEEESKEKLKDRQTTFSLEKCIKKHGETKGRRIFEERQTKWSESIFEKRKDFNYDSHSLLFFKNKYGEDYLMLSLNDITYGDEKREFLKNILEKNINFDDFCSLVIDASGGLYKSLRLSDSKIMEEYFSMTRKEIREKIYNKIGTFKCKYGILRWFNGHICRSTTEYEIAKYLFDNNIEYEYEKNYPNSKYICDFYIKEDDLYIEYLGMLNIGMTDIREKYIENYKQKEKYCIENNINYLFSDKVEEIINKLI